MNSCKVHLVLMLGGLELTHRKCDNKLLYYCYIRQNFQGKSFWRSQIIRSQIILSIFASKLDEYLTETLRLKTEGLF